MLELPSKYLGQNILNCKLGQSFVVDLVLVFLGIHALSLPLYVKFCLPHCCQPCRTAGNGSEGWEVFVKEPFDSDIAVMSTLLFHVLELAMDSPHS